MFWKPWSPVLPTFVTVVIHKDDLLQEVSWCVIHGAVH